MGTQIKDRTPTNNTPTGLTWIATQNDGEVGKKTPLSALPIPDAVQEVLDEISSRRTKVIDYVDNTQPPPTETAGHRYVLDLTGTSHANWDGAGPGHIVEFNGTTWDSWAPEEGWIVWVDNEDIDRRYIDDGGAPYWEEALGGYGGTLNQLVFKSWQELTISDSGRVDFTKSNHTIDTYLNAASGNLDYIGPPGVGEAPVVFVRPTSGSRTVVIRHDRGNITCSNSIDITLDDLEDTALMIYHGGWYAFPLFYRDHAGSHESGGGDEITHNNLAGLTSGNPHTQYVLKTATRETNNQTGTTYTLALTDDKKVVELDNASAITLTVPLNSSVAFPIGTEIELWQQGAGQVTVSPAAGVTVRSADGDLKLRAQYSSAVLRKRGTDEWVLSGDITA